MTRICAVALAVPCSLSPAAATVAGATLVRQGSYWKIDKLDPPHQ